MTRDELIAMLRFVTDKDKTDPIDNGFCIATLDELERFADLIRADEREKCARVCDSKVDAEYKTGKVDHNEIGWTQSCAIAIRARREE